MVQTCAVRKTDHTGMPSGNNAALGFLIIPIGSIVWVVQTGVVIPFDQPGFLLRAGSLLTLAFVVLWWVAFGRVWRDRALIPMTLFLLCLWFACGFFGVAKLNTALDFSTAPVLHHRKVVDARLISSGIGLRTGFSSSSRQCLVTLDQPIAHVGMAWLAESFCDDIRKQVDGLSLQLSPGALGMPWVQTHALVRDIDAYKARLGLP